MRKSPQRLLILAAAGFLLAGSILLILSALPFDRVKPFADLLAKDGSLDSFSPASFTVLRLCAALLGLALTAAGAWSLLFRQKAQKALLSLFTGLARSPRALARDFGSLLRALRLGLPPKADLFILLGILLLAVFNRVVILSQPMAHDEAYTFEVFAFRPLWGVISDYHLPNNHIFHSLLVHFSALLFGIQPWVVRLPAFLAGVLLVPAGYLLARSFYDRYTALVTAGMVAVFHTLIHYSANARGYSLVMLITALVLVLGVYVKGHRNHAAWGLIILLSALGFYTLPVMLYPFGLLLTWLLLSALAGDLAPAYPSRKHFFLYLVFTGLATALLSALLYAPVLITSGVQSLMGNTFVGSLVWNDFIQTLPIRLAETWREWNPGGLLWGLGYLLAFSASLVFHRRTSSQKVPLQLAAGIWLTLVLLLQRPNAWARIWTFLLPLLLLWAAAGVVAPLYRMGLRQPAYRRLTPILTGMLLVALAGAGLARSLPYARAGFSPGEAEQIALFLKPHLSSGDIVVVAAPRDAELWYYFHLHEIPKDYVIGVDQKDFQRSFVVVYPNHDQTIESVIQERGPELDRFDLGSTRLVREFGSTLLYECLSKGR